MKNRPSPFHYVPLSTCLIIIHFTTKKYQTNSIIFSSGHAAVSLILIISGTELYGEDGK